MSPFTQILLGKNHLSFIKHANSTVDSFGFFVLLGFFHSLLRVILYRINISLLIQVKEQLCPVFRSLCLESQTQGQCRDGYHLIQQWGGLKL